MIEVIVLPPAKKTPAKKVEPVKKETTSTKAVAKPPVKRKRKKREQMVTHEKKLCPMCGRTLSILKYWKSESIINQATGIMHICTDCCNDLFVINYKENKGIINEDFVLTHRNIDWLDIDVPLEKTCRVLDLTFKYHALDVAKSQAKYAEEQLVKKGEDLNSPVRFMGIYKAKVGSLFRQDFTDLIYAHSDMPEHRKYKIEKLDPQYVDELVERIGPDTIRRWGKGYSEEEYFYLENFARKLERDNRIETSQDRDYLEKICRQSLLLTKAQQEGDSTEIKKFADTYSALMRDAKFRALDSSSADKTGGVRTIAQITQEVESDDFIPPWEKYADKLNFKQDIVDRTITYMLNFVLKFSDRETMALPPSDTPKIDNTDDIDDG